MPTDPTPPAPAPLTDVMLQRLRWWPKSQQPIPAELRMDLQALLDAYAATRAELADADAAGRALWAALEVARETILIWHGPVGADIYERESPEMKRIDAALTQATRWRTGEETE